MVVAACGSSDGGTDATTTAVRAAGSKLTERDAERLARMLYENHQGSGASFTASADYAGGAAVALDGEVDWTDGRGAFTATSTFADGRPQQRQDVIYTEDAVYTEATAQEANLLAQQGHAGVRWIRRAPDVEGSPARPGDRPHRLPGVAPAGQPSTPGPGRPHVRPSRADRGFDHRRLHLSEGQLLAGERLRAAHPVPGDAPGFAGPVVVDLARRGPRGRHEPPPMPPWPTLRCSTTPDRICVSEAVHGTRTVRRRPRAFASDLTRGQFLRLAALKPP